MGRNNALFRRFIWSFKKRAKKVRFIISIRQSETKVWCRKETAKESGYLKICFRQPHYFIDKMHLY